MGNVLSSTKGVSSDFKTIIIVVLILFLGYQFLIPSEHIETEVKEHVSVDIEKVVEEAINNHLQQQQPQLQPTIVYQDRVVQIEPNTIIPNEDLDKVRSLNKYKDTTYLDHAKIYSEILSDGKVYSNKITAEVDVKTITRTKEITITKYGSGLFVSPGINMNPMGGIDNVEAGVNYIYKGHLGIGAAIQFNINTGRINYGVKLHKKIF